MKEQTVEFVVEATIEYEDGVDPNTAIHRLKQQLESARAKGGRDAWKVTVNTVREIK